MKNKSTLLLYLLLQLLIVIPLSAQKSAFGKTNSHHIPIVPKLEDLKSSPYGSFIKVKLNDKSKIVGELISVENRKLRILSYQQTEPILVDVSQENVKKFKLRFASVPELIRASPILTLLSLSHGYFFLITIPLNLMVTLGMIAISDDQVNYTKEEISYEELKMFSRFPQGIPSAIDVKTLR